MENTAPKLSVVIPTRNESDCVHPLLSRLSTALGGAGAEVIFVDDSDDSTPAVIRSAASTFPLEITLHHRPRGDRPGGLGGALMQGFRAARGNWVCVLDGDLQHPPELVPQLLEAARSSDADLVVASRKLDLRRTNGLSRPRAALSIFLNRFLRGIFRAQLREVPDPLSGMFAFRRGSIELDRLVPHGYKILLDLLVRQPGLRVANVPFEFAARRAGASKAGLREGLRFFRLVSRLWLVSNRRLARFLLVGFSGLLVNSALLALFVEFARIHYLLGAGLATQGSTLWNFAWSEGWVFPYGHRRGTVIKRIIVFFLMNNVMLLFRTPLLGLFVEGLGIDYLIGNGLSIVILALLRFGVSDRWIWGRKSEPETAPSHFYAIHGIVVVSSSVPLPELAQFRVPERPDCVDLSVATAPRVAHPKDPGAIVYDEGLGDAGFWIRIAMGERTCVTVSPLLERSPHVLYTNVVEPLLRWIFVRKGYALVHGACLGYRGRGLLISAATDTGKTTTVLKSLAGYPFEFLADDMVILGRDGTLFTYPKPLTISHHTLRAAPTADLDILERIRLQVQSRIHSRLGRRIGIFFGNIRFPAATMNAYLQILVPPPKFQIERLVPQAVRAEAAQLTHLAILERGPDDEWILPSGEVYAVLAHNIEDAYGFPPYPQIADALSRWNGRDLRAEEMQIIAGLVEKVPAVHIRRSEYDWWKRLPAVFYGGLFGVPNPISGRYPTIPRPVVADSR